MNFFGSCEVIDPIMMPPLVDGHEDPPRPKSRTMGGHRASVSAASQLAMLSSMRADAYNPNTTTVTIVRGVSGYGLSMSSSEAKIRNEVNHFISAVAPGGEAEKAGLHVGDRVLQVDGTAIYTMTHKRVVQMLAQAGEDHRPVVMQIAPSTASPSKKLAVGDKVSAIYEMDGQYYEATVKQVNQERQSVLVY